VSGTSLRLWGESGESVLVILGRFGRSNHCFLGARLKGLGNTPSTNNIHLGARSHHSKGTSREVGWQGGVEPVGVLDVE